MNCKNLTLGDFFWVEILILCKDAYEEYLWVSLLFLSFSMSFLFVVKYAGLLYNVIALSNSD